MRLTIIIFLLLSFLRGASQRLDSIIFCGLPATNEDVYIVVDQMPEFQGGEMELFNYLRKSIKHPNECIEGTVYSKFIIGKDSLIRDVEIVRSVNILLDKEVVRVIKEMPKWIPGKHKGVPVDVFYHLPVRFCN